MRFIIIIISSSSKSDVVCVCVRVVGLRDSRGWRQRKEEEW